MSTSLDIENKKWEKNLFYLYGFSFFQVFLVSIPVIVPYWKELGLSLKEIFALQGIFGVTLLICDIPAGYLADLFGRKKTLVIGSTISALGFQLLWMGNHFYHFVVYEIILGIGLSLQSGCDVAILYQSMENLKLVGGKAKYLGRRVLAMQVGEGIASLLGGALALGSLKWPMIANAVTPWFGVVFASLLYESHSQKLSKESHAENFKMIRKALFGHSKLLTFLIIAYVFYSFATYCAVWTLQPYWEKMGLPFWAYGVLWSINCFLIGFVGQWAHQIEKWLGSTWSVLMIAVTPIIGYLGMGQVGGWWGLAFMAFFPLCRGLNMVLFQDAVNSRVPQEIRATTNSIGSLGMRMLFIIFGPLLGQLIDLKGPAFALETMGYIYIIVFFVVALPLLSQRRYFVMDRN